MTPFENPATSRFEDLLSGRLGVYRPLEMVVGRERGRRVRLEAADEFDFNQPATTTPTPTLIRRTVGTLIGPTRMVEIVTTEVSGTPTPTITRVVTERPRFQRQNAIVVDRNVFDFLQNLVADDTDDEEEDRKVTLWKFAGL